MHDRGEGAVWRCGATGPIAAALMMCDVRRGRSPAVREQLCERMLVVCEEVLGIEPTTLKIEFTQHAGDELFHPHRGRFNSEWTESDRGE